MYIIQRKKNLSLVSFYAWMEYIIFCKEQVKTWMKFKKDQMFSNPSHYDLQFK